MEEINSERQLQFSLLLRKSPKIVLQIFHLERGTTGPYNP
jgi:hypothetical protein